MKYQKKIIIIPQVRMKNVFFLYNEARCAFFVIPEWEYLNPGLIKSEDMCSGGQKGRHL